MSTQHTPGPWIRGEVSVPGPMFNINTPERKIIAIMCREGVVALIRFGYEANARLIAAAPDLLEALESGDPEQRKRALAKARGGAA